MRKGKMLIKITLQLKPRLIIFNNYENKKNNIIIQKASVSIFIIRYNT